MIGSTETITKEVNKKELKYTCFSLWDKENKKYISLQLTHKEIERAIKRTEQKKHKSIVRFIYKVFHTISSIF